MRRDASPQFTRATADGHDAVLLRRLSAARRQHRRIAREIIAKLAEEQNRLPADVRITNWYDQSDLITASARSVRDAVLIGMVLAAMVLLLFLRNWQDHPVAALTVPIVWPSRRCCSTCWT